ncbi:Cytochrome b561 [Gulbenkiania indica]|uniref:Cytochrome b561 n=1 Tax=Gulbenkiania indica TaxID=375574 RepID=A0A0K6GVI6_9NEIS|nr:cytochrome b [Gulbenkiania indica]CUA82570.1 Cytochrome b561 [Gulbenkiania indica]
MNPHSERYTALQVILHWLMALLLVGTFAFGWYLSTLPLSPEKFRWIAWHKWAGILALALVIWRLTVRFYRRPPALPASMSTLAVRAAHAGHVLLYLLMLAVPLSGWTMSSAYGIPVVWLGLLPLPDLVSVDPALGERLKSLHETLVWLLALLVVGHVLAALKHQLIDRDGLMSRMRLRSGHH